MYTYIHIQIDVYPHTDIQTHRHTDIHTDVHTDTYRQTHTDRHPSIHPCMHACIHDTDADTYTYIYTIADYCNRATLLYIYVTAVILFPSIFVLGPQEL